MIARFPKTLLVVLDGWGESEETRGNAVRLARKPHYDRLLATSLTATWRYDAGTAYGPAWHAARRALLETFASHESESVQHTLHAMGRAVLDSMPDVCDIHLVMPNRHHLPVDLTPFGLANRNEIFVATDQPFGLIQATIRRN